MEVGLRIKEIRESNNISQSKLAKKIKIFSLIGVSIIGSISHSIGQILVGLILINKSIIYYLPYLLLFSIPTGLIVGIISQKLIKNMSNLN